MATISDDVVVKLRADMSELRRELRKSTAAVKKNTKEIKGEFRSIGTSAKNLGKLFGGVFAVKKIKDFTLATIRAADEFTSLEGRLREVTKATGDFEKVNQELFDIAQRTGTAFSASVATFQRLAIAAGEIGKTNDDVLEVVEAVQQLGAVGGASTEALRAGLLQFGQSMSSGVVRAEEFNSILENLPLVAEEIAKGMGKTTGQLRNLVIEGKVASKDVFQVLLDRAGIIEERFKSLPDTVEISTARLSNSFGKFAQALGEATGFTEKLSSAIDSLAISLERAADAIKEPEEQTDKLKELYKELTPVLKQLETNVGDATRAFLMADYARIRSEIDSIIGKTEELTEVTEEEKEEVIEQTEAAQKLIDKLRFEVSLINKSSLEKAKAIALRKAGAEATKEEREEIEKLVESLEKTEEVKRMEEAVKELGLTFESAFEDAILNGEKLSDVLKGLEKDIARIIIRKSVTEPLAASVSSAFSGFSFGSLFDGFRASGGAVRGGRDVVVGENGPEVFRPSSSGQIVSNENINNSGGVTINVDARGAAPGVEARVIQALKAIDGSIEGRAVAAVVNARQRDPRLLS